MTRLHSDVKNLGFAYARPQLGSIEALTQFAAKYRPMAILTTLTLTGDEVPGDIGLCLVEGHALYGHLVKFNGASWENATPASNLSGYISASQCDLNTFTANQGFVDALRVGILIAGAIDGMLITGAYFRTAASGTRFTLDADNGFKFIHTNGVTEGLDINGNFYGWGMAPPVGGSYSGAMIFGKYNTSLDIQLINDSAEILLGGLGGRIYFKFGGSTVAYLDDAGGGEFNLAGNIIVSGNVDGVDVSAFKSAYDSHAHGVTGAVMGANMTNTLGSSGIIDAKTNSASVRTKGGPSFVDASSPPTMADGETLVCACSGNSKTYSVHRDGSSYFYSEMYGNALPPALH